MEKREPLYIVGGDVNWCSHYGNSPTKGSNPCLLCTSPALQDSLPLSHQGNPHNNIYNFIITYRNFIIYTSHILSAACFCIIFWFEVLISFFSKNSITQLNNLPCCFPQFLQPFTDGYTQACVYKLVCGFLSLLRKWYHIHHTFLDLVCYM